ncbi:MAG TPA: hypothetical protein VFB19_07345 [Mycobacterium sp.]|nr:hypothetical protein [Mycobacterium sp.]
MPIWAYFFIAFAALIAVLAIFLGVGALKTRRTERLKEHFGPEYGHTVDELGDQRAAEKELAARQRRHDKLDIVALSPQAQEKYARQWQSVQAGFIDSPDGAVRDADRLVTEVMRERGYPVDDFERRAAEVSVEHPEVVQEYRSAHQVFEAQGSNGVGTDDQREAFVHYRALFERLLELDGDGEPAEAERPDNAKEAR